MIAASLWGAANFIEGEARGDLELVKQRRQWILDLRPEKIEIIEIAIPGSQINGDGVRCLAGNDCPQHKKRYGPGRAVVDAFERFTRTDRLLACGREQIRDKGIRVMNRKCRRVADWICRQVVQRRIVRSEERRVG